MQDEHGDENGTVGPLPWTVGEVFVCLFLIYFFWGPLALYALQNTGFFRWFYGPSLIGSDGQPLATLDDATRTLLFLRLNLWAVVLAFPAQFVTIPAVLNSTSGTRLERLGLTLRDFGRNILAGASAAVVMIPLVFGVNLLMGLLFRLWTPGGVSEHALTRLIQTHQLFPAETALLVISAVVTAPILEELIFRGLLLKWFAEHPWASHLGVAAALFLALAARQDQLHEAWDKRSAPAVLQAATPALFVLALVPLYALAWRRASDQRAPALIASSLVFAAAHSAVWPTPIALFVLALGLGYLVLRRGSLVPSITVHALLNGTSCVLMFLFPEVAGP
jgi:membrane protease YdiL (CAAX protease family)